MATFLNDLRVTELATGEASGTWGVTTNLNLSLIADAFGFGTEAITTNADTHTTTIADGAADPGRSLFLKYTGTLDSACTITIGPNTVSKLWFIENATSGGFSIIIKQGSGSTISIPNGQTKAIYSDGAGSGGAMVDAFQDLSIPDLFVDDDLTVGDDLILSSDGAIVKFGADADTTLTHTDGTGLTLNSTNKLTFGDAASFVQQSSDGVLRIDGEATIDLNASTAVTVSNDLKLDSDSAVLGFGADNDTTLTHTDGSGLTLNSTNKIMFNDASQFIQGSSATVLSLGATDEIDLTATAIDINGTVDMSSTLAVAGKTTLSLGSSDGTSLELKNTSNVNGSQLTFFNDSSSPADDDRLGQILFNGDDSAGNETTYVRFRAESSDVTDGSEDGKLQLSVVSGGSLVTPLQVGIDGVVVNEFSTSAQDFRVEGDSEANLFFVDASTDFIGIGTNSPTQKLDLRGAIRFGTTISDVADGGRPLIYASDGSGAHTGHALVIQARDGAGSEIDFVTGTTPTTRMQIGSSGGVTIPVDDNSDVLHLKSTDDDANVGPVLLLNRVSSSPADSDVIGSIDFDGRNDAGQAVEYAQIIAQILDASDGTEDGALYLQTIHAGTKRERVSLLDTETVLNNASVDLDFRVESDGSTHALFVQASDSAIGINNSSPTAKLHIVEATSTPAVKIKSGTSTNQNTHITMFNDNDGGTLALGVFGSSATTFGPITAGDGFLTSNQELVLNSQNSSGVIKFGVGSTPSEVMRIDVSGEVTMTRADNGVNLTLKCTDTDANAGPNLKLERNATGADNDLLGTVVFLGLDDAGVGEDFARIFTSIDDASHGSVDGRITIATQVAGTERERIRMTSTETVFNEDSVDLDFRIESDNNASFFDLDAGNDSLTVQKGQSGSSCLTVINSSGNGSDVKAIATSLNSESNNTNCHHLKSITQGIATFALLGNGSSTFTSDERLKTDIVNVEDGHLEKLNAVRIVNFKWKADPNGPAQMGVIAQEMEDIFPDLVVDDKDAIGTGETYKSVSYSKLNTIALKAIQELSAKVEALEAEVAKLKGE